MIEVQLFLQTQVMVIAIFLNYCGTVTHVSKVARADKDGVLV